MINIFLPLDLLAILCPIVFVFAVFYEVDFQI